MIRQETLRRFARTVCGSFLLLVAMSTAGCSLQEALIDGAYGGVSDTIAAVISETLLGLVQ